jgi:hypothetical protein
MIKDAPLITAEHLLFFNEELLTSEFLFTFVSVKGCRY